MANEQELQGRRVAVLAADGFELVELTVPVAGLKAAGARVEVVSLRPGRIRGVNLHEAARRVRVDYTLSEVSPDDYDALLIPGGFINPDMLRQSAAVRHFVRGFDARGKPIATLCHGPWVLVSAGLARGRILTSWPGVRDDVVNAGATWRDEPVVRDGNWITSRGPQDLAAFVPALVAFFAGAQTRERAEGPAESAPPRDAPPKLVLGAMKWIPRPGFRAAAFLGVLAAVLVAGQRTRLGGFLHAGRWTRH